MANKTLYVALLIAFNLFGKLFVTATSQETDSRNAIKTKVVVLGGGVAGITAAQTLHENGIEDFVIVEYNGEIGGRNRHTDFGTHADGSPYTVELGSNWVQQIQKNNPIWILAKKYNISYTLQDDRSLLTYNQNGPFNMTATIYKFMRALAKSERHATKLLRENRLDQSERAGLMQQGWYPATDPAGQAIEWFVKDDDTAIPPEQTSQIFQQAKYPKSKAPGQGNIIKGDVYVHDQRGFNYFLRREAATFLKPKDPRLLLSTIVTNIEYNPNGVIVKTKKGQTIHAEYAICTFSLGVLQASVASGSSSEESEASDAVGNVVSFSPPLPSWKQRAISNFGFGTYTKMFLQFSDVSKFWPGNTQLALYADPTIRGNYPIWQSLSLPGWLPHSGIIFATVVSPNSAQIEAQSDETTKAQLLDILRNMFGKDKIPEPKAFMYPRWGRFPWARGSYSYWPPGVTIQDHENLRGTVDGRLWFAGEATSDEDFGYLHGAWFEGRAAAVKIATILKNGGNNQCSEEVHYATLNSPNGPAAAYNRKNGFGVADLSKSQLPHN